MDIGGYRYRYRYRLLQFLLKKNKERKKLLQFSKSIHKTQKVHLILC